MNRVAVIDCQAGSKGERHVGIQHDTGVCKSVAVLLRAFTNALGWKLSSSNQFPVRSLG